jgi:hypothetical protein
MHWKTSVSGWNQSILTPIFWLVFFLNSGREGMHNHITNGNLAALQQNDLGWIAAIEGWWSFEWAYIQDSFYRSMNSNKTGRQWLISLIKRVWQIAWELWAHRNDILHQQENAVRDEEENPLNRKVRHLYFKAYSVLKNTLDGCLLKVQLLDLEKKSVIYRREWATKTELALACATILGRRRNRKLQKMRATMKRWLRGS